MQRATARTKTTRPASALRNLDGTVSRCFASSVCSNVPWKAKAHGVRVTGAGRSEVAEWEEPRHPGPAVAWVVPHITTPCNTFTHICPTADHASAPGCAKSAYVQGFRRGMQFWARA